MSYYFSSTPYRRSHFREPRGTGRWAFGTTMEPDVKEMVFCDGTLTEAKKKAAAIFKGNGLAKGSTIYVLP